MNDNPRGLSDLELLGAAQRNAMFLRQENDRLEAENKALRQHKTDYMEAAEETRRALEAENRALREELERLKISYRSALDDCKARWTERDMLAAELKALRARAVVVVPERDSGGSYYEEGWNACLDELARLNGKTIGEGLLRKWLELMEHGDFREGHCMCGSAVNAHGIGDGHAPVDAGEYYAGQVMEELRAILAGQ